MRGNTKTALGIDLGKRRLSVALVEKNEQGFRVLAAASADWPTPAPEPAYGRVLSRLLAQLGWRSHVRGARVALALAPDSLIIQLLDLPRRMPANLGDFVRSECQQYVALSGKTVVSDFCGLGLQKRLLVVAADGDEIQKVTEACSTAANGIDTVEPSALAYARAFCAREKGLLARGGPASVAHPPCIERDVLVAVLGPHTLTTTVFRRGTLDLVRIREVPVDANTPPLLCRWLAEELKAVWSYYQTQGSPSAHDHQVCLAVHESAYRADDIAPLLAAEAGTKAFIVADVHEPLLASGMAQEQTPLEGVGPGPQGLHFASGSPSPTPKAALGSSVSLVAVGAALKLLGTEGDDLRINLLPQAVAEARSLTRHMLLTTIVGVALFLAVFATAQLLARTTGALNRRIEETRLSQELYTASALIAEEKFVDQEIARLRRQVEPLRQTLKGRQATDWPDILRAVREATPPGVSVTQLQCSDARSAAARRGPSASLHGLAPSCPAAEAFVRNLEAQKPFSAVSLTLVQKRQRDPGPQPHTSAAGSPTKREESRLGTRYEGDGVEYRIDCLLAVKGGQPS
ncbi:MAG: hypothetical protein M1376_05140 [Planctomycetes bacterium]|nr:hypothetical protein [Planctomycetota bacterium]